jgi:hypothetical protein
MLAPFTALVGKCGQTKVTKAKGTKKVPWHWDEVHQRAFDHVKATIARDVVLAYPDYSEVFKIYTDASSKQLGALITQKKGLLCSSAGSYLMCNANTVSPKLNYLP